MGCTILRISELYGSKDCEDQRFSFVASSVGASSVFSFIFITIVFLVLVFLKIYIHV